jgi:hypothetical protein
MLTYVRDGSGTCPGTDRRGKVTPRFAIRDVYAEGPRGVQSSPGRWIDPGRHRTSPIRTFFPSTSSDAEAEWGVTIIERIIKLATNKIVFILRKNAPTQF